MFVITGGGTGIGQALAQTLAERGKRVLIAGRREKLLHESAALSPNISVCCTDISTESGQQKLVRALQNEAQLDGLIHNAGSIDPITPLADLQAKDWDAGLALNVKAPLFLTQALLSKLQKGRVLHIGSGAAHFPVSGWAVYCVSKAALFMLYQCWQLEYKTMSFGSVMPGIIDTDMQNLIRHSQAMEKEKLNFFLELKKENRLLSPKTVALFLSWLLLDIKPDLFSAKEWDIYDTGHHAMWLKPPHTVPHWE